MSQSQRLASGGRIDRDKILRFTFNDKPYTGFQGDTLASALLANDVKLVARSFKYHRPRGVMTAGAEEPNAIVQIGSGAWSVPNCKATQVELYNGLQGRSVNCWPSVAFDALSVNSMVARVLPAGFYYKTFMWPQRLWMKYETFIRKSAGLGVVPTSPDPDHYDKVEAHCDVLVIGAGPAGLAGALEAAQQGARVLLVDEQSEPGGQLLSRREEIDGKLGADWLTDTLNRINGSDNITVLSRTTAFGYYDDNFVCMVERVSDHQPPAHAPTTARERLWHVRAGRVILATGSHERSLVFGNNDRPGVMLASAVSTYINRYAVSPGSRTVVFTNNDAAHDTVLDLLNADQEVAALVDVRSELSGVAIEKIRDAGVRVYTNSVVTRTIGQRRVKGVQVASLDGSGSRTLGVGQRINCDVVATSGGFNPAVHLHAQSGGKSAFDDQRACFVPIESNSNNSRRRSIGACAAIFSTKDCVQHGRVAGRLAAEDELALLDSRFTHQASSTIQPLWSVPTHSTHGPKQFVDLQNDTSASDLRLAVREGYRSIEHVKRYTLLGFGTDQGKLGNITGMAIVADALGQTIGETGTTTFRPPYTPVTFGAMANHQAGDFFDPVRKTPLHDWHAEHGALFEDVGQWKRPWYYLRDGENMHQAVERECIATREGVGILDASTLGKIDIQGPDAAQFLDWMYTNNFSGLKVGRCRYGLMLGEDGMVMDDGVTARLAEDRFLMTTTTGGAAHVLGWMERWQQTEWPHLKVFFTSVTDHIATISLAGPRSRELLAAITEGIDFSNDAFGFMSFQHGTIAGVEARIARISFSGELAFEINVQANYAQFIWDLCWDAGEQHAITPYGTETMHVLRAEKGFVIVGQDTDGSVTPDDLGMNWIVSKKKDFLGRRSLQRKDTVRDNRKQLVGLRTEHAREVLPEGAQLIEFPVKTRPVPMLGHVTSSYFSNAVGGAIALALVKGGRARLGTTVYASLMDDKIIPVTITEPVFFDHEGARQNG